MPTRGQQLVRGLPDKHDRSLIAVREYHGGVAALDLYLLGGIEVDPHLPAIDARAPNPASH
jgi:hypothetical protein